MNAAELRAQQAECLSVEGGFLPRRVPAATLSGLLATFDAVVAELPMRFHGANCGVTAHFDERFGALDADEREALLGEIDALDEPGLDRAFSVLSVLGHTYRWDHVPASQSRYGLSSIALPLALDVAWRRMAQRFDVPRVGTLYSMVLCNWRLPGRGGTEYLNEEIDGERLIVAHPWLRPPQASELHCFLMTAIETEARGALAVQSIVDLVQAVEGDSVQEVLFLLDRLLFELEAMSRPFRNNIQRKKIAPDSFLTLIQPPTIWGMDAGDGEGILEGASGPQLGSLQCIDALLGVGHQAPISQAILHTRKYLPARHRRFIGAVEAAAPAVRAYIKRTHDPQARRLFNACIEAIVGWRRIHEKRGGMYLRGDDAGSGAYTSTGGVVSLADERVRVFEQAMVARQTEVLQASLPTSALTADDELAHSLPALTAEDREALLDGAVRRDLETDEVLIQAGARREGLYLLRRGAVRVVRSRGGEPVVIARIGAGALFGEMSFFENEDASASVEGECPGEIAVIPREHIFTVFRERPGIATRFYQSLAALVAQRLRDTSRRVADESKREVPRAWRFELDDVGDAALRAAARAAGRALCDDLESLDADGVEPARLEEEAARIGARLVSDCVRFPAAEVVRFAWPRLAESALAQAIAVLKGSDAQEVEVSARLAAPPEGRGEVGRALDGVLRHLPTISGYAALATALVQLVRESIGSQANARVLAVLPAAGRPWIEGLAGLGAHLTLLSPDTNVCEQTRSAARRVADAPSLRIVPEPIERLRRQAVETFWRPFDVIVTDTLLLDVDDDDTEPLLDWLFALMATGGVSLFGAALGGAPDEALLQAIGRFPACRRDAAGVISTFDETHATSVDLPWRDAAGAWCIARASVSRVGPVAPMEGPLGRS